jgi:hypothetical protein
MVFIDGVRTGSITYKLIINKLPTEDKSKVILNIEYSLKKGSNTLELIAYDKTEPGPTP